MAARCGREGTSLSFSEKMAGFSPNALFSAERLGYPIKRRSKMPVGAFERVGPMADTCGFHRFMPGFQFLVISSSAFSISDFSWLLSFSFQRIFTETSL